MTHCIICEQKKGKRFCPLKDAMVCSGCCGLVQTEGACPQECPFFKESKTFATEKRGERENQLAERFKRDFDADNEPAMQTFKAVSGPLNDLFAERAGKDSYLEDKDLVEALDDLTKDLREGVGQVVSTEGMKLNRAGNLVPLMKQKLDSLDATPSVPPYLIVPCLEILRGLISLDMKAEEPRAYIEFLLKPLEKPAGEEEEPITAAGAPVAVDIGSASTETEPEPEEPLEAEQEEPLASDLFEEAPDDRKHSDSK